MGKRLPPLMASVGLAGILALAGCGVSATKGGVPAATAKNSGAQVGTSASAPKSKSATSTASALPCAKGVAASGDSLVVSAEPDPGVAKPTAQCWASIPYTAIAKPSTGTAPAGVKGQFKVAWSAKNLYVLAWIQKWPLEDANTASTHDDDTVEFYLAGDHKYASGYDANDCQVNVVYTGRISKTTTCNTAMAARPVTQVVAKKGYFDEIIVPWQMLNVNAAAKGQQYAFSVAVDIANAQGARVAQLEWAGGANNDWSETKDWGNITLG